MGALSVQILGGAHPLAAEWLRRSEWHPHLQVRALIAPEHAGLTAEDLHGGLFGFRSLPVLAGPLGGADLTVICPGWAGDLPAGGGQRLDLRPDHGGFPILPELLPPPGPEHLAALTSTVLSAALALEPLLRGRVVSPREATRAPEAALEALPPLLTGHFSLAPWPEAGLCIPLFEGYSEHDALAAYREAYRAGPWVRLRRDTKPPASVTGSPACELRLRILPREDPEIPIPLLQVVPALDSVPALAARAVSALNLSRGWPPLLGLLPNA